MKNEIETHTLATLATRLHRELAKPVIYNLDRHAAEKEAAIKYWRFLHNGVEVDISSGTTVADAYEILGCTSDDILEPIIEHDKSDTSLDPSTAPMPGWQETSIRLWLNHIGETDPHVIAETLEKCHNDFEARHFFLTRAAETLDERARCCDCNHFQPDKIGDGTGIGSCAANAWKPGRGMVLYPNAKRFCGDFKQEQS